MASKVTSCPETIDARRDIGRDHKPVPSLSLTDAVVVVGSIYACPSDEKRKK